MGGDLSDFANTLENICRLDSNSKEFAAVLDPVLRPKEYEAFCMRSPESELRKLVELLDKVSSSHFIMCNVAY
jgi:hypothetical protein